MPRGAGLLTNAPRQGRFPGWRWRHRGPRRRSAGSSSGAWPARGTALPGKSPRPPCREPRLCSPGAGAPPPSAPRTPGMKGTGDLTSSASSGLRWRLSHGSSSFLSADLQGGSSQHHHIITTLKSPDKSSVSFTNCWITN